MHALATIDEARAIAARFGISDMKTDEALAADVTRANGFANTRPGDNALASPQWCSDHPRTVRTRLYCPREAIAYWYVQEAGERDMDDRAHADFCQRAYG